MQAPCRARPRRLRDEKRGACEGLAVRLPLACCLPGLRVSGTSLPFRGGPLPLPALRLIAWGANRRAHLLGLPYGDQVLIIKRFLFFSLGGFAHRRPEDLDLVLRLKGRACVRILTPPVSSSGRRWLEQGYWRTTLKNWLALVRHLAERLLTSRWPKEGDSGRCGRGGQGLLISAPSPKPPSPTP